MTVARPRRGPIVHLRKSYWSRVLEHTWWSFFLGFVGFLAGGQIVNLDVSVIKGAALEGVTAVLMFFYKMGQERLVELDRQDV